MAASQSSSNEYRPPYYCLCTDPEKVPNTKYAACVRQIDRFHDKSQICSASPSYGHPIYPLTGSKRNEEILGIFSFPLKLVYDTKTKVPTNDPAAVFKGRAPASFGELWQSDLHRRLLIQPAGSIQGIQAARGAGVWVSFVKTTSGTYLADADVTDRLVALSSGWRYYDSAARAEETYDSAGNLTTIAYADGRSLGYTYSTAATPVADAPAPGLIIRIQDKLGRSVQFQYEQPAGAEVRPRVRQIIGPAGQAIVVLYDTAGNLAQIIWPDGQRRQFLYENQSLPWALTGVVDENASRLATYGYDTQGRANETQWAGGVDHYSASYGDPPSWNIVENYDSVAGIVWRDHYWQPPKNLSVTRPLEGASSLTATLLLGAARLTSQSQPAGSGCAASTSSQSFDANANVSSKDDFNGSRACYAYDASRNLETVRVEGLANTATCSSYTAAGAALPAATRKVSTSWHPDWKLTRQVAEPGRLTTSVYNGQPDPFGGGALASCAPGTATLPDGKPIAVLCKQIEQATTDTDGHFPAPPSDASYTSGVTLLSRADGINGSTAFADSSPLQNAVIPQGGAQISTAQSKFGGSSAKFVASNVQSLRIQVSTPAAELPGDFTVEAWAYWSSDPTAKTTIFANQLAGGVNLSLYRHPAQNHTLVWYDGQGQVNRIVGTTRITNGVWHHVALVRAGTTMTIFLDGVSQGSYTGFTSKVSPVGTAQYIGAFNGSGDLMDGYIDEVRVTKGQALYGAAFTPPAAGFPAPAGAGAPLDATVAARVRSWTYDQNGQVLTAKGPRTDVNDTTTYEYYSDTVFTGTDPNAVGHTVGDLKKTTNALGQSINYTKYDKHGQVLESTDLNGVVTANTYDARQRLLTTTTAGLTTSYVYDFAGQLLKVTQPDASWTGYEYDAAHRMNAVKDNLGNRIEYTLDNAGNKTAEKVKDPGGLLKRQLTRSFDALGRVQQTTGRE